MDINYFFMQLLDSTPFCMMLDFSQVTLLSLCECKSTNCVLLFLVYYSIGVFFKTFVSLFKANQVYPPATSKYP